MSALATWQRHGRRSDLLKRRNVPIDIARYVALHIWSMLEPIVLVLAFGSVKIVETVLLNRLGIVDIKKMIGYYTEDNLGRSWLFRRQI